MCSMGCFTFARHAESVYNVAGLTNGDPLVGVGLTPRGARQASRLAEELALLAPEVCVHTRFARTLETARLAIGTTSSIPLVCEPLLDDIGCGSFEGGPVGDDHAWRERHSRDRAPDGGESLRDAALRIARGLTLLAQRPERTVAVVSHDLIVRYTMNAVAGGADISGPLRGAPNATIFKLDRRRLVDAAERIHKAAAGAWGREVPGPGANGG